MLCALLDSGRVGQHKARGEEPLTIVLRNRSQQVAVVVPDGVARQCRVGMIRLHRCARSLNRDLPVTLHHHGQILCEEEVPVKEVVECIVIHPVIKDIVTIGVDRSVDPQQIEQCGIDVEMLDYAIGDLTPKGSVGDIEADRHHRPTGRAVVLGAVTLIGVVARDDEDRMVVPRLILDRVEEASQRLIGILRCAVNRERTGLTPLLIPPRELEGVVIGE